MRHRFRGDSRRIFADEINKWNKLADQQARGEHRKIPRLDIANFDPSSRIARVKNTSGSDRSAFDCMSIDVLSWDLETTGESDVLFKLITADPTKAPAVLVEPIANGAVGLAVLDGLAIAKVGGGTGTTGTPDATNHRIKPGVGNIRLLSAPHATNVRLLPVILHAGMASTPPLVLQLGFYGIDSSNATKWGDFTPNGWANFTDFTGTPPAGTQANMLSSGMGISVVTVSGAGIPARAEGLRFTINGRYRVTTSWQIDTNGSGTPVPTGFSIRNASGFISPYRKLRDGTATGLFGYNQWMQDERIIEVTGSTDLWPSVAAGATSATNVGMVSIALEQAT